LFAVFRLASPLMGTSFRTQRRNFIVEKTVQPRLKDGTLVEHKADGYRGRIEGITEIKSCFTHGGAALPFSKADETFQYRIAVSGESRRHIAPAEDLQVVFEETRVNVSCFNCHAVFRNKPGTPNKPGGQCECGGWICPECLACDTSADQREMRRNGCVKQTRRMKRRQGKTKGKAAAAIGGSSTFGPAQRKTKSTTRGL